MTPGKRWIRTGALLSLLAWGCQTTHPISPSDLPRAPEVNGEVRVTMTDGDRVVLRRARIEDDRILGETEMGPRSIPLDEVVSLDVKRPSEGRTVAIALGATALLGVLIIGMVN